MNKQQEYSALLQNIENLRLENVQLKKNLEKEEFLHKVLYRQWRQLRILTFSKENELKWVGSVNSFYRYGFYLVSGLLIIQLFFPASGRRVDQKIVNASQIGSPQMPMKDKSLTSNRTPLPDIKAVQKETIQSATIQPIPATVNDAVINTSLPDSVKSSIYWDGWVAYYQKASNPYQKSGQEYEAWLEGWKQGENDARKQ